MQNSAMDAASGTAVMAMLAAIAVPKLQPGVRPQTTPPRSE